MCDTADGSLLSRTRALLAKTEASYLDIHAATGCAPNWLSLVATGKIKDPSVNKIQKLYEYLHGRELRV